MLGIKKNKTKKLTEITIDNRKIHKHVRKIEGATVKHAHKFLIKRWDSVLEVKRQVVVWILILVALITATGMQLVWNGSNYMTEAPALNGSYVEAVLGPIETLNPIFAVTQAEKSADYLMFSRILNYDSSGHLNYDLANNLTIDSTGKIYKVSIRQDALWHDGKKLTTKDIAYTIDLMKDESTHSSITGWSNISVKVIDDYNIEFTLKEVYAPFRHALNFPVLPAHILSELKPSEMRESNFSQNPIGSGPFKFKFIQKSAEKPDEKMVYMSRNEDYYGGKVNLASFQLHAYKDSQSIVSALAKGEINAATGFSSIESKDIKSSKYSVQSQPINSGVYAILNMNSPALSDKNVRKALQIGTNTQSIKESINNKAPDLYLPFVTDQLSGSVPAKPAHDLTLANTTLDKAGWSLGKESTRQKDGKQLKLNVTTIKNIELESVAKALAGQWSSLGIIVETKVIDPEDVGQNFTQTVLQPRNYDVLIYKLDIGGDPDMYVYWHSSQISSSGLNLANYSNTIADDALVSARDRLDPNLRNAKYLTFANQWLNDVPAIGLYQSTVQYASSKNTYSFDKSYKLISPVDRYNNIAEWASGSRVVYKTP